MKGRRGPAPDISFPFRVWDFGHELGREDSQYSAAYVKDDLLQLLPSDNIIYQFALPIRTQ